MNKERILSLMFKRKLSLALLILSLCGSWGCHADTGSDDKTLYLTSLEWPPYSSANLPQQGAAIAIATAAFANMGYTLKVNFFPWSRAVAFSQAPDNHYIGYFPEYYSDEIAQNFIYSDAFASGPLGFAERKDNAINWTKLEDLAPYKIGVVQDYINTKRFDEMVKAEVLTAPTTLNDTTNLKKLVGRRVDIAVVDKHTMNFLFKTDPALARHAEEVQFNAKILAEKKLYICFNKTEEGYQMANIFNQGLKSIDIAEILSQHL